jgi:hypothetical protein
MVMAAIAVDIVSRAATAKIAARTGIEQPIYILK